MTEQRSNQIYSATTGTTTTDAFITVLKPFAPSATDVNYPIGKRWVDTTSNVDYILSNFFNQNGVVLANWISLASGGPGATEKLQGNAGGVVGPDGTGVIQVRGDASTINIIGDPVAHTLTANVILPPTDYSVLVGEISSIKGVAPGVAGQVLQTNGPGQLPTWESISAGEVKLEGNTGGAVSPDGSSIIQVKGDTTSIDIVGDPVTHTLTAKVVLPQTDFSLLLGENSGIVGIEPGTQGYFLQSNGTGQAPTWEPVPSGPGGGTSLAPDEGSTVAPVNGIISITGYPHATSQTVGIKTFDGGSNVLQISNLLGVTPYVVGADTNLYHFQTITSAIQAASQDGASSTNPLIVYVSPGRYTENLLLDPYISIVGLTDGYSQNVVIEGSIQINPTTSGNYTLKNLSVSDNGSVINFSVNNSKLFVDNCQLVSSASAPTLFLQSNSTYQFINCDIKQTGSGIGTFLLNNGTLTVANTVISSTAGALSQFVSGSVTFLNCSVTDAYVITCPTFIYNCVCNSGNAVFASIGTTTVQMYNSTIFCNNSQELAIVASASNATLFYGSLQFLGSAKKIDEDLIRNGATLNIGNLSFDGGYTTNAVDGGLWIGSASGKPQAATLTAGSGIQISNAPNAITISSSAGGGTTWQSISTQTQAQAGNGYFVTAAVSLVLPASPTNGETIQVVSKLASGSVFVDANSKTISAGVVSGSLGASSTQVGDTMTLVYDGTSQSWNATSMIGSWVIS